MKRAVVLLLVLMACGKRGDPRPPVPVIPQATSDLVVTQRSDRIVLSWSYPALTTAGRTLGSLRRIVVYRYSEELPPSASSVAPDSPPEPGVPEVIVQFATLPLPSPVQFAKISERLKSIEGAELKDSTKGSQVVFTDKPAFRSPSGRPRRITYAVVTEGLTARSPFSNLASIVPLSVAVPPTEVTATNRSQGVIVEWARPQRAATGDSAPLILGYNVYRDDRFGEFETPVNQSLVEGTSYTDVPSYGEHEYRVTAVAAIGPPRIESDPSDPVKATFLDRVPPPAPASISALVETAAVRLVWEGVEAPDLAGYRLYRTEGAGQRTLVEVGQVPLVHTPPTTETNYRDDTVRVGISYRYEVVAVDKTGNESPRVSTGWTIVSRVP